MWDKRFVERILSKKRYEVEPLEPFEDFLSRLDHRRLAVDYGAGAGYFTLSLARYFEKVVAIDSSKDMLEVLEDRLRDSGLSNVDLILADSPPKIDSPDLVLFAHFLHEVPDPERYLDWAREVGSRIVVVIDWRKGIDNRRELGLGPPEEEKLDEKIVESMLRDRFSEVEKLDVYRYHYFLVARS